MFVEQKYVHVHVRMPSARRDRKAVGSDQAIHPFSLLSVPSFLLDDELKHEHQVFLPPPPPLLCLEHCSGSTVFILAWTWNVGSHRHFFKKMISGLRESFNFQDGLDRPYIVQGQCSDQDEESEVWLLNKPQKQNDTQYMYVTNILCNSGPSLSAQPCVQQTIGEYIMVLWHCKGRNVQ